MGTWNSLAVGDNLVVLADLAAEGARFDVAYLDPPYNTGSALTYRDRTPSHEEWVAVLRPRLEAVRALLVDSGAVLVISELFNQEPRCLLQARLGLLDLANLEEVAHLLRPCHKLILREARFLPPLLDHLQHAHRIQVASGHVELPWCTMPRGGAAEGD